MDDTSPEIKNEIRERIMRFSGEKRIEMGALMFDAGRRMVLSSFPQNMDDGEIREQLFLRLYKDDFSAGERRRIIKHLKGLHHLKKVTG
ncbi:hypothetical protein HQ585_06270 [candidate division KSB1 bacterium]|nr:hypothetical protein [candidate division KSB1 bacterium]